MAINIPPGGFDGRIMTTQTEPLKLSNDSNEPLGVVGQTAFFGQIEYKCTWWCEVTKSGTQGAYSACSEISAGSTSTWPC